MNAWIGSRRITQLDGLRALAVGLVILDHWTIWFIGGGIGVGIFFILSGFLITSLLMDEIGRFETIRLGRFYVRRMLRLYPPLMAMLLVTTLLNQPNPSQTLIATTYTTNLFAWVNHPMGPYLHTWSLAAEEQFYLLWPLLLPLVLRWPRRVGVALLLALAVGAQLCGQLGFAFGLPSTGPLVAYNPIWEAAPILIGCALALATRQGIWTPPKPSLLVAAGVTVCVTFAVIESATVSLHIGYAMGLMVDLAAAAMIIGLIHSTRGMGRVFTFGPVVWMGKRSYAIYLWHYPLIQYAYTHGWGRRGAAAMIGASFVAAELSWRLIERPVARLKARRATGLPPDPRVAAPYGSVHAQESSVAP
jgi:peptidoglycan/LPS O-acetylase OafA/YrhL